MLLGSFSAWIVFSFGYSLIARDKFNQKFGVKIFYGIIGLSLPLCPVIGWVSDVYWGRYKMIQRSLSIMWLTSITLCLAFVINDSLFKHNVITETLIIILLVMLFISLGGFQISIIQFGVDQLPDASSADIVSFSNWYVWMWHTSNVIVALSQICICPNYTAVAKLLLPACTTLALCLDYNFNHWLIKEPVSENPLKLIYRVMHYAWNNKYPRKRSAFTYCDNKHYSRIDFAKQKFGGSFTIEQVEDVKTFWRILFYFIILFLCSGFIINVQSVAQDMRYHLHNWNSKPESNSRCSMEITKKCYQEQSAYFFGHFVLAIVIPIHELVLHRLIGRLSSFKKFITGLFFVLLSVTGYLFLEIAGHEKLILNHTSTTNVTCLLEIKRNDHSTWNSLPLDYKWIMLPECSHAVGVFFLLTAVSQFICAQSPYSMKGLVTGIGYGLFGLSCIVCFIMLLPLTYTAHKWPTNKYGCGTWYLLSASIGLLLMLLITCILAWRYKKRQRGDILPNDQIFAIDYYTRYTMYNAVSS